MTDYTVFKTNTKLKKGKLCQYHILTIFLKKNKKRSDVFQAQFCTLISVKYHADPSYFHFFIIIFSSFMQGLNHAYLREDKQKQGMNNKLNQKGIYHTFFVLARQIANIFQIQSLLQF